MQRKSIVTRYENNPILKPEDMPAPCCAVYNSGVIKTSDGDYIMMSRFEELNKKILYYILCGRRLRMPDCNRKNH